jgi:hypothetical protein
MRSWRGSWHLMRTNDPRLTAVWKQRGIPVVLRRTGVGEKLRVRIPPSVDAFSWLKADRRIHPYWSNLHSCWEVPKSWFNDFVVAALRRYGRLYIVQPYREHEICSPSCLNAVGHECECSCMGANHGAGNDGTWFEVSDAFAVRSTPTALACRLLQSK